MSVKNMRIKVSVMMSPEQLKFLEKKQKNSVQHLSNRSAIIEHLISLAMENPGLLDVPTGR